jgi:hypothetical protein
MKQPWSAKSAWFAAVLIASCSVPVCAQDAPNPPIFVRSSDGQLVPICGGHVCSPEELAPKPRKPDVDLNHSFQTPPPIQEQSQATSDHTFDHALDKIVPQAPFTIPPSGAFIVAPPEPVTTAQPESAAAKPTVQPSIAPTSSLAPRFEPPVTPHAVGPTLPNASSCTGHAPPGAGALWGIRCGMLRNQEQADERRAQQASKNNSTPDAQEQAANDLEARKQIAREFITLNPDYLPIEANNAMLNRYLESNGLEFSVKNLELAASRLAGQLIQRNTPAPAPQDQYTREALQELSKDRDTAASLMPLLHDQSYGRMAADSYNNLASAYRGVRQSVCALHPEMQVPDIDGTPEPCR